ncbi:hypothetical protein PsorP6_003630 [Peronosclerospora sorghi]|uniref:Uncharacterized protein n=1 Tax=Peronosclerospora sorghi TaxID=230839 RepID=A0ACC0VPM1_9STRA|nr:hypothetical protein PsorP6_003630 [Peronosclerospora sorghi]
MVIRLEESIAAVCAPYPGPQADLNVCHAAFESCRYLVYTVESVLVILVEVSPLWTTSNVAASKFELWQVWNAQKSIKCVRFNSSKDIARGAFAVCIDGGCGVLLMPTSATSSRAAAKAEPSTAPSLGNLSSKASSETRRSDVMPTGDYIKTHLHFHLPRWGESIRWTSDDRSLNHLEWAESGDNLLLLGAGEKLSIWMVVNDSVQIYLQSTMALSGYGDIPDFPVCHFDVAPSGRFTATAGKHDRIIKVWNLHELSPYDGAPMSQFLPHTRALVCMTWSKEENINNARSAVATATAALEMLFTLDRAGNISIWRENRAPLRSFVLWKQFSAIDFCTSPFHEENASLKSRMREFGLINRNWAREVPKTVPSMKEGLLSEKTVMDALCVFHYGYDSLEEACRNELACQQMDNVTQMNTKLLGKGNGAVADTHAGEVPICGNVDLEFNSAIHLLYGVLSNGTFCIFRGSSIPFTCISPRISILLSYNGIREQLIDAHVYSVSSSDYLDQASESTCFSIEILFQPTRTESYLYCARLMLHIESSYVGSSKESMFYAVQSCDVAAVCTSMMNTMKDRSMLDAFISVANIMPRCLPDSEIDSDRTAEKIVTTNMDGRLSVFQASNSLRKLELTSSMNVEDAVGPITHSASYEEQGAIFLYAWGSLHVVLLTPGSASLAESTFEISSLDSPPCRRSFTLHSTAGRDLTTPAHRCLDDNEDIEGLNELICVKIPESVKNEWTKCSVKPAQSPTHTNDYCMVVGMHKGGKKLNIWIVSFEMTTSDEAASTVQLFRTMEADLTEARLLSIASVPLLNTFEMAFASFDAESHLTLWTVTDLNVSLNLKPVHRFDVNALMSVASRPHKFGLNFQHSVERNIFKRFSFSTCGRVAILFGGADSDDNDQICLLSVMDGSLEAVVGVPHTQFDHVVFLEWTPPVTPERDCVLFFSSATTIGMLKFESLLTATNKWNIVWPSSRLSTPPKTMSSLSSYPNGLLRIRYGLTHLNVREMNGLQSSPLTLPPSFSHRELMSSQAPSKILPAHHPLILMYLLARRSFETVEKILEHVKMNVLEHEETCYRQMADITELQTLTLFPLSQLLGYSAATGGKPNERWEIYRGGKGPKATVETSQSITSAVPARSSDLFATDFGEQRQSGVPRGSADRADMLFAPPFSCLHGSVENEPTTILKSKLETDTFSKFFEEHKNSLTFMTTEETEIFLAIVAGIKKTVTWERDRSRLKDEAALRFHASLLWPVDLSTDAQPNAPDPDLPQGVDGGTTLMANCLDIKGLCSEQIVWAALSDFQLVLVQECFPSMTMSWKDMKRLRLPFWLRSSAMLAQFAEKVAQVEYAAHRDPFSVAIFYVLLGKIRLLANLFNMANESRISDLLCNNFSDVRWKNAAIKNAYVLKTKLRYELSAAFFLLGGKITEAVSVAEQADTTLVLSFLIARLSEKWDFCQNDAPGCPPDATTCMQASSTGLSFTLSGLNDQASSLKLKSDESLKSKDVCVTFLRATVFERASQCGDLYMCFLVKYLLREMNAAVDILVTPPVTDMRSMFTYLDSGVSCMYWSAFGKSLVSACDLVRFLLKTPSHMKVTLKDKVLRLNTSALIRLQDSGLGIAALLHQRDVAPFVQKFCQQHSLSPEVSRFLSSRQRVLTVAVGSQVDYLYAIFLNSLHEEMMTPLTMSDTPFNLEERLNEEIESIVRYGGDYDLLEAPKTSKNHVRHRIQAAVVESLVNAGCLAGLDVLVSEWRHFGNPLLKFGFASPLPQYIEDIIEGIAIVASGDLISAATVSLHSKKVDQTCSNLLTMARRLLLWLQYLFKDALRQKTTLPNRGFAHVAVATVYSAICICCRYLKSPCCLYRVLGVIFPHHDKLSSNSEVALNDIAGRDICARCPSRRRSTIAPANPRDESSLQVDIPVLYQLVSILELELNEFTAAKNTSRLHHPLHSWDLPPKTPLFSCCSYWELVLMLMVDAMPANVLKTTGAAVALSKGLSNNLVVTWENYRNRLTKYALKHLLSDMAGIFFSTSSRSPPRSSSPTQSAVHDTSRAYFPDTPGAPPSPQNFDRQLLKCECKRCPWLLLVDIFTDKNELLLRLNAQMEFCSAKIDEEVRWGRLREPASRKSVLTRPQKLLLSNVTDNALTMSHETILSDELQRRILSTSTATAVHDQCVYRSNMTIKAMSINHVGDEIEMSICCNQGIFRASCMDNTEGCRVQLKGMYAASQSASFFPSDSTLSSPNTRQPMLSPSSALSSGTRSPLRNPGHLLASPSEPKLASFKPTAVTSHPFLPLFVSGNHDGRMHLSSYDRLSVHCAFQTKNGVALSPTSPSMRSSSRSIKALEIDNLGQQLGAVDASGQLFMWKFSELDRAPYYYEIVCHDKGAKGLTFLNSSTTIATVGLSSEKRNVCVWDTLLSHAKALVVAPTCHPAGATSVAFSAAHQLLITGGVCGALNIFDMRQRRVLHTISKAHETPVKVLAFHPTSDCMLSGSAGGDVKIWSLPLFREMAFLSKVHTKPSLLGDAATNILGDAASNVAINVKSNDLAQHVRDPSTSLFNSRRGAADEGANAAGASRNKQFFIFVTAGTEYDAMDISVAGMLSIIV